MEQCLRTKSSEEVVESNSKMPDDLITDACISKSSSRCSQSISVTLSNEVVKKQISVPNYFTKEYQVGIDTLLQHLQGLTVCNKEDVDGDVVYTCVVIPELIPMLDTFNKTEIFCVED